MCQHCPEVHGRMQRVEAAPSPSVQISGPGQALSAATELPASPAWPRTLGGTGRVGATKNGSVGNRESWPTQPF